MIEIEEEEFAEPFISVEQMPMLGDCKDEECTQREIMKFISRNFKYPEIAKANGVEGRVILEFVVEKDGQVGRVKILRGLDKRLSLKTDLPIYVSEDPLQAVVRGTGIALKNVERFTTILIK